jgi:hypothetical protein
MNFRKQILGSSLSLPAHPNSTAKLTTGQAGGVGQGQHLFLQRFLRSKKRNSATEKQGRAKIPSPKTPSLASKQSSVRDFAFCPPERKFFRNQHWDFRGK